MPHSRKACNILPRDEGFSLCELVLTENEGGRGINLAWSNLGFPRGKYHISNSVHGGGQEKDRNHEEPSRPFVHPKGRKNPITSSVSPNRVLFLAMRTDIEDPFFITLRKHFLSLGAHIDPDILSPYQNQFWITVTSDLDS